MTDNKPFRFVVDHGRVVRISNKDGERQIIFRAASQAKGQLFLQCYLSLSIEDRHKLWDAVSS